MKVKFYENKKSFKIGGLTEGRDFDVHIQDKNSWLTIVAIHGGKIEKMTSEIARFIADKEYNYYTLDGNLIDGNWEKLHVKSTKSCDPRQDALLSKSTNTISIHGYSDDQESILIGGGNKTLIKLLKNI